MGSLLIFATVVVTLVFGVFVGKLLLTLLFYLLQALPGR